MIGAENLTLLVARILLALMFIGSAADKFRLDRAEMQQISALHLPAPALLLRLTGVFEILGAAALVLGIYARVFAVALALFVALASVLFIKFWSFEGPDDARAMMRNAFFGNVAVIGGLMYVATLGAGAFAIIDL